MHFASANYYQKNVSYVSRSCDRNTVIDDVIFKDSIKSSTNYPSVKNITAI